MLRVAATLGAVIACVSGAGAAWGAVVPSPYGADNFGRFFHIIPPGQDHLGPDLRELLFTSMRGVALVYAFESRPAATDPHLVMWKRLATRWLVDEPAAAGSQP